MGKNRKTRMILQTDYVPVKNATGFGKAHYSWYRRHGMQDPDWGPMWPEREPPALTESWLYFWD